jgi:hypothetical protein
MRRSHRMSKRSTVCSNHADAYVRYVDRLVDVRLASYGQAELRAHQRADAWRTQLDDTLRPSACALAIAMPALIAPSRTDRMSHAARRRCLALTLVQNPRLPWCIAVVCVRHSPDTVDECQRCCRGDSHDSVGGWRLMFDGY